MSHRFAMLPLAAVLLVVDARAQGIIQQHTDYPALAHELSIAGVGDVDADGADDYAVGVFTFQSIGEVRVYSGRTAAVIRTIHGLTVNDEYGRAVNGVGDVDGDGRADFLIGGCHDDTSAIDAGIMTVRSGANGVALHTFTGEATEDHFGYAADVAGDFDNDGFTDYVVGAPDHDGTFIAAGRAYVFSGQTGASLFVVDGGAAGNRLGYSVSDAGDVNADGYDDVIVGVPWSDALAMNGGAARVYSGIDHSVLFSVEGTVMDTQRGSAVSDAGDIDMDGIPDVIVGGDAPTGITAVTASVHSGNGGGTIHAFTNPFLGDAFGASVRGAGDLDGDGWNDVLIAAPDSPVSGGGNTGRVYVISGKLGTTIATIVASGNTYSFGRQIDVAGDVNGDGLVDLAVAGRDKSFVLSTACGEITSYGAGCAGSGGFTPTLSMTGGACPVVGESVTVRIEKGLGGVSAFLFFGTQQASIPMGLGCSLNVWPLFPVLLGPLPLTPIGAGKGSIALTGDAPPAAAGIAITMQAFVDDYFTPIGFSNTNAIRLHLP